MLKRARNIGEIIKRSEEVHVVTHIDADGISAGAIASQTLKRLDKQYSIEFVKQLDNLVLESLVNKNYEIVWFTDLGSSISKTTPDINKVNSDERNDGD